MSNTATTIKDFLKSHTTDISEKELEKNLKELESNAVTELLPKEAKMMLALRMPLKLSLQNELEQIVEEVDEILHQSTEAEKKALLRQIPSIRKYKEHIDRKRAEWLEGN